MKLAKMLNGRDGIDSMAKLFKEMDTDGDGTLSLDELQTGLKKCDVTLAKEVCTGIIAPLNTHIISYSQHANFQGVHTTLHIHYASSHAIAHFRKWSSSFNTLMQMGE
jgi:Ca2+-binding EF-hand superfamily protein